MKKSIILITLLMLLSPLFSEDSTAKSKVSEMNTIPNAYFFSGFDFDGYDPNSSTNLTDVVNAEIEYIAKDQAANPRKYAIVGHSQGGLRVLAYAKMLEEKAKTDNRYRAAADNLSVVVTVSGIDQGLKALNGGFEAVNAKLDEAVSIIYDGVSASLYSNVLTATYTSIIQFGSKLLHELNSNVLDLTDKKSIKLALVDLIGKEYACYIKPAMEEDTENIMPEIQDMIPNSRFINNNVSKTVVTQVKVRDESKDKSFVEIKYKVIAKIFGVEIKVPYFVLNKTEGYSYNSVYSYESYGSNKVPYLYVVGLDNNTFKLIEQKTEGNVKEQQIRDFTNAMGDLMETGLALNIAQNAMLIGLLTGGKERTSACQKAVEWFYNIDDKVDYLLGSTEGDGLVAKESQFYGRSWHSNIIDPYGKVYIPMDEETHQSINPNENQKVADEISKNIEELLK